MRNCRNLLGKDAVLRQNRAVLCYPPKSLFRGLRPVAPPTVLAVIQFLRDYYMGTFTVRLQVGDPARRQFTEVEALVDTGATHTVLPRDMLLSLGVEAVERPGFLLADEREVEYERKGMAPLNCIR